MRGYLDDTISALVYDIASIHDGPQKAGHVAVYNVEVSFVRGQIGRMPEFLRLGIRIATAAFSASRLLTEFCFFHRREPGLRRAQVDAWEQSRLGPCRDLMKFYTSLVVLALYSRAESDRSCEAA